MATRTFANVSVGNGALVCIPSTLRQVQIPDGIEHFEGHPTNDGSNKTWYMRTVFDWLCQNRSRLDSIAKKTFESEAGSNMPEHCTCDTCCTIELKCTHFNSAAAVVYPIVTPIKYTLISLVVTVFTRVHIGVRQEPVVNTNFDANSYSSAQRLFFFFLNFYH